MEAISEGVVAETVRELRSVLRGALITAADGEYDAARSVYMTAVDRRPVAVARPVDASDVARVIGFARDSGIPLAVRSGGHSPAGHGVAEGGLVLDLTAMRSLEIDVAGRSAWAETGLSAGGYTRATGAHGLATGFGDAPTVGIGGITLSGGVGFLHRRHGLTIDNVLAAEVVTADGTLVHTDEQTHPELFWAIRGGGGNFGVATRIRYRLVEVDGVVGGMLVLPATPASIAACIAEAEAAPEALSGMINVTIAPPMPFLPAEVHGRPIIMAVLVFDGDADAAARAIAPFRALAKPHADMIAPIPYPSIYDGPPAPHPAAIAIRSFFTDEVSVDDAALLLDRLHSSPAPMRVAQFRVLGGAVARVPAAATAFAHRSRRIMANVAAMHDGNGDGAAYDGWADALAGALRHGEPGAYVGFLSNEGEARVREAYHGVTWQRLRAVKAHYDPTNLFRMNQNVPPADA